VVDLGTGSGCLAISIELNTDSASVLGVDVSAEALEVARRNAVTLESACQFIEADMLSPELERSIDQTCDIIVSNPPYVPDSERTSLETHVRDQEPHLALFSGPDALFFYRRLAQLSQSLLRPGGWIGVEIHTDYGPDVVQLFEQAGLDLVGLHTDLAGRNRMVTGHRVY